MTPTRAVRGLVRVVALPLALVGAVLMRALRPIRTIRIGRVRSERLGHLALEPELYLCERDRTTANALDLFWFSRPVCNDQLVAMWRRVLPTPPLVEHIDRISRRLPGAARHVVDWVAEDHDGCLHRTPPHLALTDDERARGAAARAALGIPAHAEHVCFIARDRTYLATTLPQYDTSVHDHRDADIRTYGDMALEIARRGHVAVRMGAVVEHELGVSHPNVIDYAVRGRSDLLDVYLFATCRFAICSASGPSTLALIFRRPLAHANVAPLLTIALPPVGSLFIPKSYRSATTGDPLTAGEIRRLGAENLGEAETFRRLGIELVDNTPTELVDLAVEMDERVSGTWLPAAGDDNAQARFWSLWDRRPGYEDAPLRIGAAFLRQHPELLED